jgi:hypothetical protein
VIFCALIAINRQKCGDFQDMGRKDLKSRLLRNTFHKIYSNEKEKTQKCIYENVFQSMFLVELCGFLKKNFIFPVYRKYRKTPRKIGYIGGLFQI